MTEFVIKLNPAQLSRLVAELEHSLCYYRNEGKRRHTAAAIMVVEDLLKLINEQSGRTSAYRSALSKNDTGRN
jgi:hypothetical protein